MKLTLSTIDNQYKINFTGETMRTPNLYGSTQVRTLGGRKKKRWRGMFNSISITIDYITLEQYDTLVYIWAVYGQEVIINTEDGNTYIGIIQDDTLDFNQDFSADGIKFRHGSLTIEE